MDGYFHELNENISPSCWLLVSTNELDKMRRIVIIKFVVADNMLIMYSKNTLQQIMGNLWLTADAFLCEY